MIVAGATDMFVSRGFEAMTMSEVVAACRISKRTLYRLFPNKLELFRSMVAAYCDGTFSFARAANEGPLDAALASIFRLDLDPSLELPRRRFAQKLASEIRLLPELEVVLHEMVRLKQTNEFARWLAEWNARGTVDIREPYLAASLLIDVLCSETSPSLYGSGLPFAISERNSYMRECIRYFVHGVK